LKSKGKSFDTPFFKAVFLNDNSQSQSCFGFVISKKVSGLAVERNRLKRMFSETISRNLSKVNQGYRVLFLVKKSCLEDKGGVSCLILKSLKTLGILAND
jgi:ribonuclease P protein component